LASVCATVSFEHLPMDLVEAVVPHCQGLSVLELSAFGACPLDIPLRAVTALLKLKVLSLGATAIGPDKVRKA
ncbi:hypothetical protein HDU93_004447, partial [Gonapodya sp. JEL0774]